MDDWQWFVAHPDRGHRTRLATPAEIDGLGRHGMLPAAARSKWVLHGLTTNAHLARIAVEPRLHLFKNGFVLPAFDPTFLAGRAFGFL